MFPMVFKVPASRAEEPENRFAFQVPGSKRTFSIPLIKYLSPKLMVALVEVPDVRATREVLETYAPGAWDLFADSDQLEAFGEAWREASGISLGESRASSRS